MKHTKEENQKLRIDRLKKDVALYRIWWEEDREKHYWGMIQKDELIQLLKDEIKLYKAGAGNLG